jgi:uncharacterized protein (DUF1800 family)
MKLTRRQTLGLLAGAGAGTAALGGCSLGPGGPVARPTIESDPDSRFLNRAAFGPRPGELEEFRSKGRKKWLDEQLEPSNDEPMELDLRLSRLEITHLQAWELRDWPKNDVVRQAQQSDLLHAVLSPWQVRERMVDFWTNHFNIYGNKGLAAYRIPGFIKNVVRENAVGSFHAMLRESAKSTAMLLYLDQQASTWENPNENYARELLELHTLGVEGGYTQRDVMEVARCFTGWTEERRFLRPRGSFRFDSDLHDKLEKTVLGHTIPAGGGVEDGERVIDILVKHPSTAKYISKKLCAYFLGEEGTALEDKVAAAYLESPVGEVSRMLRVIFESDLFLEGSPTFKRPYDFVVSSLRALDATTDGNKALLKHLENMGQPTHMWPMPDGYPMQPEAWNGSVLGRWNFAIALCNGQISGTKVNIPALAKRFEANDRDAWVSAVFGMSSDKLKSLRKAMSLHTDPDPKSNDEWAKITALCLCAPEFQWR